MTVRAFCLTLFGLALVAGIACGGDETGDAPTAPAAQATNTRVRATAGSASSTPSAAGEVEVTGIVGAVNASTRTIEINRIAGAGVDRVEVSSTATIRRARGGTLALSGLRPSDRIIARGELNDGGDALIAGEITVQDDVVPGAEPGG